MGSCSVRAQHCDSAWEKMVGETEVVPPPLEIEGARRWEVSQSISKSLSVGAPAMDTVMNIIDGARSTIFSPYSAMYSCPFFLPHWTKLGIQEKKKIRGPHYYYSLLKEELRVLAQMGPQLLTGCSILALQSRGTLKGAAHHPCQFWHQYYFFKEIPFPLTHSIDLVRFTLHHHHIPL